MSPPRRKEESECTCHCGGSMFYRHLHAPSCPLSVTGEEAPESEVTRLRAEVERLTKERDKYLADLNQALTTLAASQARVRELEMTPPKACRQSNLPCGHNAYWRTVYDTCMACRAEQAEQQRDRLRVALAAIAEQTTEPFIRSQAQQALGESVNTDRPEL